MFTHSPRIVTDGLVLYLDAANPKSYSESGTVWKDLSGNGNDGTLVNGVGYSNSNGGSLTFDGVNDYATLINTPTILEGTVQCWIKVNSNILSTVTPFGFYNTSDKNNTRSGLNIGSTTSTYSDEVFSYYNISKTFGIVARDSSVTNEFSLFDDTYHMITVVVTNSLKSMYLDSVEQNFSYRLGSSTDTDVFIDVVNGVTDIEVGREINRGGRYYMNGNISNVQIYNRALTPQEILQNYKATKGRYGL